MKINFRQGIVNSQQTPFFLQRNPSGNIDFNASLKSTIISFSEGSSDYLLIEDKTVENAWVIPQNTECWLYWDIDKTTAQKTYGYTLFDPFTFDAPSNPSLNQMYFDKNEFRYKSWNGQYWIDVIRVIAGYVSSDGRINPQFSGSQINYRVPCYPDTIVLDDTNNPIKKYTDTGYEFYTVYSIKNFKNNPRDSFSYSRLLQAHGEAEELLTKHYCVCWKNYNTLELADPSKKEKPAFALVERTVDSGELVSLFFDGFVINRTDWNWLWPPHTPLYVGENGKLSTEFSIQDSIQRVGYIVSPNTIYVDFQEQYNYYVPDVTIIPSPTPTVTPTITPTTTPSPTPSVSPTHSLTLTPSPTTTPTVTPTTTPTITVTASVSASMQLTVTPTPSITNSVSLTPSLTPTPTPTPPITITPTPTPINGGVPSRINRIIIPNNSHNITSITNFNNSLYAVDVSSSDATIGTITATDYDVDPNIPSQSIASAAYYAGIYNYDGSKIIISKHSNDGSWSIGTYDGTSVTAISYFEPSYTSGHIVVIDNVIYCGRSIGTGSGQGWFYVDYPTGTNPFQLFHNDGFSGCGHHTIPFKGKYYLSGDGGSTVISCVPELTTNGAGNMTNTTLDLDAVNDELSLTTDGNSLICWIKQNAVGGISKYAYSDDGVTWQLANFPQNLVPISRANLNSVKNNNVLILLQNSSTNEISLNLWNSTTKSFTYLFSFPSMASIDPNMTELTIKYVSHWIDDKIYISGTCVISGQRKGIIFELI